jgi:TolB protein
LWVVNADGSDARPIVQDPPPVGDQAPTWSPDGSQIAFIAGDEDGSALWVVRPDGSDAHRVRKGNWQQVAWSPDGGRLALGGFGEANPALFIINADGTGLEQLAEFDDMVAFPSWSPDGTRVAVMVHASEDEFDYRYDIHVVNVDGSGTIELTDWEGFDGFPVWSPDGRWILFSSDRGATAEQLRTNRAGEGWFGASLYLMRPDGSELRLIVDAGEDSLLATSWVR